MFGSNTQIFEKLVKQIGSEFLTFLEQKLRNLILILLRPVKIKLSILFEYSTVRVKAANQQKCCKLPSKTMFPIRCWRVWQQKNLFIIQVHHILST